MRPHLGRGRNLLDVAGDLAGEAVGIRPVDELQAVNEQARLLAERDRRPPLLPALATPGDVERGAEDADGDASPHFYPMV